jgi:hypothetical protein
VGSLSNEERESPRTAHCIKSTASKFWMYVSENALGNRTHPSELYGSAPIAPSPNEPELCACNGVDEGRILTMVRGACCAIQGLALHRPRYYVLAITPVAGCVQVDYKAYEVGFSQAARSG